MSIKELKQKFFEIEEELDEIGIIEIENLEERISDLEREIYEKLEVSRFNEELQLQSLLKKIDLFKEENDFYDADSELDGMFPDRHDDDFDEDSTYFESTFGKD